MSTFIFVTLIIIIVLFLAKPFLSFVRNKKKLPYQKSQSLLTPGEKAFYPVLLKSLKGEAVLVMAKVRFADLLHLPSDTKDFYAHLNKITSKHVDFVLCEPHTLKILAVIELDDPSHLRDENRSRDEFKNSVLEQVNIPIVRILTKRAYSENEIYQKIKPFI